MRHWLKDKRGFLLFLLCFGFFRTAIADWNPIPSASMKPTLLEGDVVFVNRLAYDLKLPLSDVILLGRLGEPRRGDVVTFSSPATGARLIKRIVALPGERVELRAGRLFIDGRAARYQALSRGDEQLAPGLVLPALRLREQSAGAGAGHAVQYLEGITGARRDFGPVTVPAGQFFMLGDNRDNSEDSRFIGSVPREKLIGRAERVLVSADILGHWTPRPERFGLALR